MTRIKAAAIMLSNGAIYVLPPPHRHPDIFCQLQSLGESLADSTQGFVTEDNDFVTREQALKIAKKAGQCKWETLDDKKLYTEDLF